MITKALILLTDRKSNEYAFSEVAGTPLYKRIIFAGQKAGINEFLILCTDEKRSAIEASLNPDKRVKSKINIMNISNMANDRNGTNAEMVRTFDRNYFIINGNAVFDYRMLQRFSLHDLKDAMAAISIDTTNNISPNEVNGWYVKLSNDNVVGISNDLEDYDGKATGIVLASPGFTNVLTENLSLNHSSSLYEWMETQLKDEKIKPFDIKDNLAMGITSKPQLQEYEERLYNSLGASVDGPIVDKYINRKISRQITRQLVKTPITPNQTTFLSLVIGIVSAWFFWQGGYWNYLVGALVFQFSFVFDQCDGEIARLKFMESKFGGWFDVICDSIIRTFMILGMTRSLYLETNQTLILILGILSSIGIFVSTILSSYETLKKEEENLDCTDSGPIEKENKISAFVDKFNNTDSYTIILFICILSGQLVWFLWTIGIGSFVFTLAIMAKSLLSCRKTS